MKSVLITGFNGFLGTSLARTLSTRGIRVVGLVRDRNFKTVPNVHNECSVVYGGLEDIDVIRYAMTHYEVDTVFHLGAMTILRQSVVDPLTCYRTNIMGTVNVLEAARQVGVKKVVVASSDKAYGTYEQLPYIETMAVQSSPDAYSTSKACGDLVSQSYASGYGLDVSIVRAGNIYGPGDLNLSRLIPRSVLKCLNNDPPQIYKGVGEYKREFMYIDDVVDAYLVVEKSGKPGESYNVGGSGFLSIIDTVGKIVKLTNCSKQPEIVDKDFVEIKEQYLDSTKIENLGWTCRVKIDEGLERAVDWYSRYKSAFVI